MVLPIAREEATTTFVTNASLNTNGSTACQSSSCLVESNDQQSPFAKVGSPALVLAFLAIGLFAGGLVSLLFFRRYGLMQLIRQRQLALRAAEVRGWASGVAADAAAPPTPRSLLRQKPILWDAQFAPSSKRRTIGAKLASVTVSN